MKLLHYTKDLKVKPYESVADSAGLTADWN